MGIDTSKRLTDAELVAQLWHTRWLNQIRLRFSIFKNPSPESIKEAKTLLKFATLPHYDEVNPEPEKDGRITEAELLAELWHRRWIHQASLRLSDYGSPSKRDRERLQTLIRFASLPIM